MIRNNDYTIRTMTRCEIDLAVEWAAQEGWNPGLADSTCFHRADPEGFLIGLADNEPVAVISVVRYGTSFAFLGFYIVHPDHRGKGYGLAIWNEGLSGLEGRTVGLDGVVAQQDNYRRSGFELAWRNIRYMGYGGGVCQTDRGIVPLSEVPLDEVVAYDRPFFPDDRRDFIECWINAPGHRSLGFVDGNGLSGYGVIRPCRKGYKIGPLFADSSEIADLLFCALKSELPDTEQLFLDIPEVNLAALSLVKRHEMSVVFETARMYKGMPPELPTERLFGITTFELG